MGSSEKRAVVVDQKRVVCQRNLCHNIATKQLGVAQICNICFAKETFVEDVRPHDILQSMATTFKDRNAIYGDNYKMVGELMEVLHPEGFTQLTKEDHELGHLWSLMIVKLSRFAISGLTHKDSVHDLAVYCAMIEAILTNREG